MAQSKVEKVASMDSENTNDDEIRLTNGTCSLLETDGPSPKVAKLDFKIARNVEPSFNAALETEAIVETLRTHWAVAHGDCFKDNSTGIELYNKPFQICILPEFLHDKGSCHMLMKEVVENVKWSRKQMDLYEFYQSADLSNLIDCKMLTMFLHMLRRRVRPWLEKVTNLKLDYVSASCSMYTCGDYLLVHDDLLKDRQVAFVYYLSPWQDAERWTEEKGGCLEIFNSDERCFPHFPVCHKISPKNNQFAFFKVGSRSFHQVGEVTTFDYPRMTINGWFHGASNNDLFSDNLRPFTKLDYQIPQSSGQDLVNFLNEIYLKPATRQSIQKRIEDNSEICLYEFLKQDVFEQALEQLLHDETFKWRRQGPANAQNYEVLEPSSANGMVAILMATFASTEMFALLRDYTDLDLAGPNALAPQYSLELQRWTHGNYTVLGDGSAAEENLLDLIYYLNAADGAGVITYLSAEADDQPLGERHSESGVSDNADCEEADDSVLLTITPVDNSLNVVYRCEGTTKFTKYVSRNTPLEKGPVFVLSCSYKE